MFLSLNHAVDIDISTQKFGTRVTSLHQLSRSGFTVVDALVASTDMFQVFYDKGFVSNELISSMLPHLEGDDFATTDHVLVRSSLPISYIGIDDAIKVGKSASEIQYAIEKIYRSWFDNKARSFRVVNSIKESEGYPAILIQPFFSKVLSLVTRAPSSGEKTNMGNYQDTIHNVIPQFRSGYLSWLADIERAMKRPSKVYFVERSDIKVCGLAQELMTNPAWLRFLHECYSEGAIDKIEYVMQVEPPMIGTFVGYDIVAASASARGLPASEGVVMGRLIFRTTKTEELSGGEHYILFMDEFEPGDLGIVKKCCGVVSLRGGATSHAAVTCRGLMIPCVSGARSDIAVSEQDKQVSCQGKTFAEFHEVIVNGTCGTVDFADPETKLQARLRAGAPMEYVNEVRSIVQSFELSSFGELPINVQFHLAELKQALARIGEK